MKRSIFLPLIAMLAWTGSVLAQKTVTGTITDANGNPMIGVNILEEGTATGTITDIDGNYSLNVSGDDAVLIISYTGFETIRQPVGTQSVLAITISEDTQVLGEVVVSALGFKQKKDEMGSTASVVNPDDITRSGETNLLNALGAKASNVQINRSNGDPGAGSTIRIRGANTIESSSNPLIIVDGIPISNSTTYGGGNEITGGTAAGGRTGGISQQSRLNDLNPNDIESVQILKGASAAALWGSRAANGVVVITTKSGRSGKIKVNYKVTRSFDEVNQRYEMQDTWGQGRNGSYSPTIAEAWGDYIPERSGAADVVDQTGQYFEAADGTRHYPIDEKNSKETFVDENWDGVFQTGGFWQNDLTISGGSDRATYFFSLSRLDQEGIIRNSDYDRTNLRLNNKFNLTDWLSVTSKAAYSKSNSNRIQQNSNTAGLMLGLLRTPPDFDQSDYIGTYYNSNGLAFPNRHRAYRRYLGNNVNPIYNNPLWTIHEQIATSKVNRFLMSQEMNITPTNWLQLTLRGGVDNSTDKRVYFFPVGSGGDRSPGVFAEDVLDRLELNFDAIAKSNFRLNNDINLTATLGWNINDRRYSRNSFNITGFLVNARKETTDLNTAAGNSTSENFKTLRRSNRGYGILGFDLYDQVFVSLTGAMEAASTTNDPFFYPAADVAWQFTKGLDMGDGILSFGKLRASWGRVGIQPPVHKGQNNLGEGDFSYSTYSDPLDITLFGGGFRRDDDAGNPDLKPEIKTEWEIGTDLRFFNDRLSLGMTYYQNEITDIIIDVEKTPSSGFDTEVANAADMENKGFEAELGYEIIKDKDWTVGVFGNFARNKNEVTRLEGTETIDLSPGASVSSRAIVGHPLGALYGTGSQTNPDGSFILDDNGFPQITTSPIVLGDPNPDWRAGFGTNVRWKGFGLNVLFEHSQGGEYSPRSLWVLRRFGTTKETANRLTLTQELVNFDGEKIPAGSTVRGNIANFGGGDVLLDETWYRHGIGGGFGDNQAYNFSIADATFTRLRELTLSYNLNNEALRDKTKLGSIVVAVTGRNLFLWDDIPGIDPEINQVGVSNGFGIEYFTNPSTRSILFSLSITY